MMNHSGIDMQITFDWLVSSTTPHSKISLFRLVVNFRKKDNCKNNSPEQVKKSIHRISYNDWVRVLMNVRGALSETLQILQNVTYKWVCIVFNYPTFL
jgi:hypothetical protein